MAMISDPEYTIYRIRKAMMQVEDPLVERIITLPNPNENDYILTEMGGNPAMTIYRPRPKKRSLATRSISSLADNTFSKIPSSGAIGPIKPLENSSAPFNRQQLARRFRSGTNDGLIEPQQHPQALGNMDNQDIEALRNQLRSIHAAATTATNATELNKPSVARTSNHARTVSDVSGIGRPAAGDISGTGGPGTVRSMAGSRSNPASRRASFSVRDVRPRHAEPSEYQSDGKLSEAGDVPDSAENSVPNSLKQSFKTTVLNEDNGSERSPVSVNSSAQSLHVDEITEEENIIENRLSIINPAASL
ncbi:hypothetical protein HDU76_010284, partial [Blyttiomyces sp. JEL0837]